jgi:hypothetical protein
MTWDLIGTTVYLGKNESAKISPAQTNFKPQ